MKHISCIFTKRLNKYLELILNFIVFLQIRFTPMFVSNFVFISRITNVDGNILVLVIKKPAYITILSKTTKSH